MHPFQWVGVYRLKQLNQDFNLKATFIPSSRQVLQTFSHMSIICPALKFGSPCIEILFLHLEKTTNCIKLMQYRIAVKNPGGKIGPGAFLIMKAAYDNEIKGECRHSGQKYFSILAEGDHHCILNFIDQINKAFPGSTLNIIHEETISSLRFSEFDIMEQNNMEFNVR